MHKCDGWTEGPLLHTRPHFPSRQVPCPGQHHQKNRRRIHKRRPLMALEGLASYAEPPGEGRGAPVP